MNTYMERVSKLMPKSPKFLFWFLSPLLLPLFAYIYCIPITLLVWLGLLPLGEAGSRHVDRIMPFARGLCIIFSLGTILWLWRMVKTNFLRK